MKFKFPAALEWEVPEAEVTAKEGMLYHKNSEREIGYGVIASAAAKLSVSEEVSLKSIEDFKVIGSSKKNVDGKNIVTEKPMFSMDHTEEGMLIAMVAQL